MAVSWELRTSNLETLELDLIIWHEPLQVQEPTNTAPHQAQRLLEVYKFWENLIQILKRHMENWIVGITHGIKGHIWTLFD
jgi:hypothetical protein